MHDPNAGNPEAWCRACGKFFPVHKGHNYHDNPYCLKCSEFKNEKFVEIISGVVHQDSGIFTYLEGVSGKILDSNKRPARFSVKNPDPLQPKMYAELATLLCHRSQSKKPGDAEYAAAIGRTLGTLFNKDNWHKEVPRRHNFAHDIANILRKKQLSDAREAVWLAFRMGVLTWRILWACSVEFVKEAYYATFEDGVVPDMPLLLLETERFRVKNYCQKSSATEKKSREAARNNIQALRDAAAEGDTNAAYCVQLLDLVWQPGVHEAWNVAVRTAKKMYEAKQKLGMSDDIIFKHIYGIISNKIEENFTDYILLEAPARRSEQTKILGFELTDHMLATRDCYTEYVEGLEDEYQGRYLMHIGDSGRDAVLMVIANPQNPGEIGMRYGVNKQDLIDLNTGYSKVSGTYLREYELV